MWSRDAMRGTWGKRDFQRDLPEDSEYERYFAKGFLYPPLEDYGNFVEEELRDIPHLRFRRSTAIAKHLTLKERKKRSEPDKNIPVVDKNKWNTTKDRLEIVLNKLESMKQKDPEVPPSPELLKRWKATKFWGKRDDVGAAGTNVIPSHETEQDMWKVPNDLTDGGDKKWDNEQVLDKIDDAADEEKRKWGNKMKLWGKRDGDSTSFDPNMEIDDKRWSKNVKLWGKRDGDVDNAVETDDKRWSKNVKLWGKRDGEDTDFVDEKRWGNKMKLWGKRDDDGSDGDIISEKKWDNKMKLWGKRDENEIPNEELEKKWDNKMKLWGKRGDEYPVDALAVDDKRWDNKMKLWGKRDISDSLTIDNDVNKKWGKNMKLWGKRDNVDDMPSNDKKWNKMKLWG